MSRALAAPFRHLENRSRSPSIGEIAALFGHGSTTNDGASSASWSLVARTLLSRWSPISLSAARLPSMASSTSTCTARSRRRTPSGTRRKVATRTALRQAVDGHGLPGRPRDFPSATPAISRPPSGPMGRNALRARWVPASSRATPLLAQDKCDDRPAPKVDWQGCNLQYRTFGNGSLEGANLDGDKLTGARWVDGRNICDIGSIGRCT